MFSVTSEAVTNTSFQAAPARSAKPDRDPASADDSFGALVDSNTPAESGNNRAAAAADAQSGVSQRRTDEAAAAANAKRSRDDAATDRADQAGGKTRNDSDDQDTAASKPGDAGVGADATEKPRARFASSKADASKSIEKPAGGDDASAIKAAADSMDAGQQPEQIAAVTPAAIPSPVAVAIQAPAAPTDTVPATPVPGQANAPLAIAAAAIAASTKVARDIPTAPPLQTPIDSAVTAPTPATATVEAAATARTDAQAAIGEAVAASAKQPLIKTETTAATDMALTAAVGGAQPVAPKVTLDKISNLTPVSASAGKDSQKAADPSAIPHAISAIPHAIPAPAAINPDATANAQPLVPAGQSQPGPDAAGAAKAEAANATSTAAAKLPAREHAALPDAKLAPADQGVQPPNTFQTQLQTIAATPAAVALTATAATAAAVPIGGLALELAATVRSGKTSFEIRLDPAELGRIDVRIDVDRHGQVTSHLTVEKPETLSMLRQDAPQLQRALDDAGFKTGDGGLQFSLRDQSSSGRNDDGNGQGRHAQRLIVHEEDTVPATVAGRTYGRMLGSSSGVDIRI